MLKRFLIPCIIIWSLAPARAQVLNLTDPGGVSIKRYEVGIFPPGTSPNFLSLTQIPLAMLNCDKLPTDDAADGVPNPTLLSWLDPQHPGKTCQADVRTIIIALMQGVGYRIAIRAISNGVPEGVSGWEFWPKTFRRAPRGLPCAMGTGVEASVDADMNGKPVHVTICVQP